MAHEGWQQRKLHQLLAERPKNGYSPSEASEWTGSLMLGLGCLGPDGFRPTQLKNAPRNIPKQIDALLSPGDVLISRSNTRDAVGFVGIFQDVGAPCIYPDLMMRLKLADAVEDRFVVKFLQSSMGRRQIEAAACGTSGSMVKLNRAAVEGICIPAPPILEQRRIVEVLDTLDNALQKADQLISKLKQMKQGLLHNLLTCGIDENSELRNPEQHPEQFKKSPLGRIPRGWELHAFGELLALVIDYRGRTPKKLGMEWGGYIPALSANNVKMGEVDLSQDTYYGSEALYSRWMTGGDAQRGDVLITMEAPLGNIAQIPDNNKYILSQRVILLRFDASQMVNDFAAWQMRTDRFQKHLIRWSTGTTATGIQRAQLVKIPMLVPPISEQVQIADALASVDARLVREQLNAEKLRLLKQGLMEDLLTGRVPVTSLLNETTP